MLTFPSLRLPDSLGTVVFDVRRITTEWEPDGASWIQPWRNPGGDFDSTHQALYALPPGDTTQVSLDVTSIVRAWQGGDNFGLLLKRPNYEGGGFRGEGVLLRKAITTARLKLYFTRLKE
jgi:hypothetical protein